MSFVRYPEYKDSGVAWLGEVPAHWDVMPLKRDIEFVTSGARGWAENYADDGDLFLRIGNLTRNSIRLDLSDTQRVVVPDGAEVDRTQVQPGDILFSITAYLGSVAVVPEGLGRAFVSQHVALVRPRKKHFLSEWAAYVAISYVGKTHLETTGYGGTKVQLSLADVTSLPMVVPLLKEQATLVAFLDRQTAKIDELVAEQRQLMELLKEKRQAVISHAVTRGLNPDVSLKPSGIEWLGDVPEHWDIQRIKHLARTIEQGWSPQCESFPAEAEGEWGVLKVGCVNGGTFRPSENKLLPPHLEPIPALAIRRNDLLISRANTRELVGGASVAERDYPTLMLCDKLYRVRFDPEQAFPQFVSLYLGSTAVRGQIELEATGASASMVNIGQSVIMELVIAAPPLEEQRVIVETLARELGKFDTLTAEAQRAIDLLQERRTALISAAVTGQIKVTTE